MIDPTSPPQPQWRDAQRFLSRVDPTMKLIIKAVGPCTLGPRRDYFVKLCQSIFSQQVSTVVAKVLFERFRLLFPRQQPTPHELLKLTDEQLRGAGASRQKVVYLRDLASHFATDSIPTRKLSKMTEEQIIEALVAVKGIGRWTAEMFLMFALNRPDVWPVDDLGIQNNVTKAYGLKKALSKKQLIEFGEKWRPWRTVASWYLWRSGELKLH